MRVDYRFLDRDLRHHDNNSCCDLALLDYDKGDHRPVEHVRHSAEVLAKLQWIWQYDPWEYFAEFSLTRE
jgi:hypothetical protein